MPSKSLTELYGSVDNFDVSPLARLPVGQLFKTPPLPPAKGLLACWNFGAVLVVNWLLAQNHRKERPAFNDRSKLWTVNISHLIVTVTRHEIIQPPEKEKWEIKIECCTDVLLTTIAKPLRFGVSLVFNTKICLQSDVLFVTASTCKYFCTTPSRTWENLKLW